MAQKRLSQASRTAGLAPEYSPCVAARDAQEIKPTVLELQEIRAPHAPESEMIAFTIPGEPVAFARSGGKGTIRFTPKKQRDFMALVQLAASKAMDERAPFDGPIEMIIRATYLIPSSWSKKKAAAAKWRTSKPDADNIAKIICDAINTIVFADDAQVASLAVQKTYGPLAGVTVSVQALADHEERAR